MFLKVFQFKKIKNKIGSHKGFTLIEAVIGSAIFAILVVGIYTSFSNLSKLISVSRDKVVATNLLNEQFEIIRNMPFADIGLQHGIPSGLLLATSTVVRDNRVFSITRTIRNIDDAFDGTIGGSPNDLSPADYKMVQISITCDLCKNFKTTEMSSYFSPKNLETASTNGALFIRVFDANGNPVPQASVSIVNSSAGLNINETTDNNGNVQIVDAPPGQNAYRIVVTKSGYTTDRTYASTVSNPNPVKPDATVLVQKVTQISFIIDKVSTINVRSRDMQCNAVPNAGFTISGAKLIGTNPNVLKWSGSYSTDASGEKTLNNIEWDLFTFTPTSGLNLVGINPASPFSVLPNAVQNVDMIFEDGEPNNLLVAVYDSVSHLPLSEVNLTLTQGSFTANQTTGRGYMEQTDWSLGSGQVNYDVPEMYFSQDGNIETTSPAGQLSLKKTLGKYALSGTLTSSIFDTGTTSNFSSIVWKPTDQPAQTGANSVKFQLATAKEITATTTWQYLGPDGTAATYYTISNNNISSVHNGDRYYRYKVYMSTANDNRTPVLSSVAVTYTSSCVPPGQAHFSGLSHGNHRLTLQKTGYQTQQYDVNIITNDVWQGIEASMQPE